MKNRIRRAGTLLLCLLLCLSLLPAGEAEASNTRYTHGKKGEFSYEADFSRETLGDVIERYLAKKGYDEHYFAIGWVDLASGEEWYYNPDLYLFAGSTYKFPLAMLCLDKVASGELSLDQRIGSYDLERDLHDLIVDSSNIVAELLKYHLSPGDPAEVYAAFSVYSGIPPEELPKEYFQGALSPRYVIGTLRTLYEDSEKYGLLLDYMKEARPTTFFNLYSGDYEVAHKYGAIDAYTCDSGIVYTERPFLLTVLTHCSNSVMVPIGEIARIAMDYAEYLAENVPVPTPAPTPAPAPATEEAQPPRAPLPRALTIGGGVALFGVSVLLFALGFRKKR